MGVPARVLRGVLALMALLALLRAADLAFSPAVPPDDPRLMRVSRLVSTVTLQAPPR